MTTKPRIYVSDVLAALAKLEVVNSFNLADCEIIDESGEIYSFTKEQLKDWSFVGLSNAYFVEDRIFESIQKSMGDIEIAD